MWDIEKMTPEERKQLAIKLAEEEQKAEQRKKQEREEYKILVEETVKKNFPKIKMMSETLSKCKKEIFEEFSDIVKLKTDIYGVKEDQRSHTFTTQEGLSITIGHRVIDAFDDTVHIGIAKVKSYITKLTEGENKKALEEMLDVLLKKNKDGNLKASRVLELERIAGKINDDELTDGVQIIKDAYKPAKSSTFVEAYYKDENGKKVYIPLNIASVE